MRTQSDGYVLPLLPEPIERCEVISVPCCIARSGEIKPGEIKPGEIKARRDKTRRDKTMWWTTDNRVQRQPTRFVESSSTANNSCKPCQRERPRNARHLKLPISADQAAANLRLQESGADCNAEVPRLRKDIRSLEVALRKVVSQSNSAASVIDELQVEKRQQLQQINQLVAELQTSKTEPRARATENA